MFRRVQIAQYGINKATESTSAYTSNFYIRSKRKGGAAEKGAAVGEMPSGSQQITEYELSQPGSYVLMKVAVPKGRGYKEGENLVFLTPEDNTMMVKIPHGVSEGQEFVVKVPKTIQTEQNATGNENKTKGKSEIRQDVKARENKNTPYNDEKKKGNLSPLSPGEPVTVELATFLGEDMDEETTEEEKKDTLKNDLEAAKKNSSKGTETEGATRNERGEEKKDLDKDKGNLEKKVVESQS